MNNIVTLIIAAAVAVIGALFVALDSIGIGIALWVAAAVISQSITLAEIWREFGARRARDPQRAVGVYAQLYDSARAVIAPASSGKT